MVVFLLVPFEATKQSTRKKKDTHLYRKMADRVVWLGSTHVTEGAAGPGEDDLLDPALGDALPGRNVHGARRSGAKVRF